MSASVQTSAQTVEPDLFAEVPPVDAFYLQVKGVLLDAAEVVTRHTADGLDVPVICMDLCPLSGAALRLHAELVFSKPEFGKARTTAGALPKGAHVVVYTPLQGVRRDFLPDVRAVFLLPSSKAHS